MNRKAFTLIELLVVVAIIGILAAVGEAVLGIGNVSVLTTSSGTSQTHTMVPKTKINKDGSKSTSYRMIKINKE